MNSYGRRAQRHWAQTDPARYATIEDPENFFTDLGDQVQQEIQQHARQLEGSAPPGETYLEQVGRLNMARLAAEEEVLRRLVLISPPQPGEPTDDRPDLVTDVLEAMRRAGLEDDEQD